MRLAALTAISLFLVMGCKSGDEKSPAKTSVKAPVVDDDDDDGAIEVPKELMPNKLGMDESKLDERMRLSRENFAKDLAPGEKLELRLKGVKSLKLSLTAKLAGKPLVLTLDGSRLKTYRLDKNATEVIVPMQGLSQETLRLSLPAGEKRELHISGMSAVEGEIVEWKLQKS